MAHSERQQTPPPANHYHALISYNTATFTWPASARYWQMGFQWQHTSNPISKKLCSPEAIHSWPLTLEGPAWCSRSQTS